MGEFSTEDDGDPCELAGEDDSEGRETKRMTRMARRKLDDYISIAWVIN